MDEEGCLGLRSVGSGLVDYRKDGEGVVGHPQVRPTRELELTHDAGRPTSSLRKQISMNGRMGEEVTGEFKCGLISKFQCCRFHVSCICGAHCFVSRSLAFNSRSYQKPVEVEKLRFVTRSALRRETYQCCDGNLSSQRCRWQYHPNRWPHLTITVKSLEIQAEVDQ